MKRTVTFIVALHNVKIEGDYGIGDRITDSIRITNNVDLLRNKVISGHFVQGIGTLEAEALMSAPAFAYAQYPAEIDIRDHQGQRNLLTRHLYEVQAFLHLLWLVRDNAANIELGFLEVRDDLLPSAISSNFIATIHTMADGQVKVCCFSREELRTLRETFRERFILPTEEDIAGGMYEFRPYGSNSGTWERAWYFLQGARAAGFLPVKVAHMCTSLETLFLRDSQELSFRMPLRTACFLSRDPLERYSLFLKLRSAYSLRSRTVHGSTIKPGIDQLRSISENTDKVLRQVFNVLLKDKVIWNDFENLKIEAFNEWMDKIVLGVDSDVTGIVGT